MTATAPVVPFGYLSLDSDGTVNKFGPFDKGDSTPDPDSLIGMNFFHEVCTFAEVEKLERQFKSLIAGEGHEQSMSTVVTVTDGHRERQVHIGFVRSPMKNEVLVTVSAMVHPDLPMSAQIRPDALHGTLADASGALVVVTNEDFWRALATVAASDNRGDKEELLHELGMEWGLLHSIRVEGFVQRENSKTLGELQIQVALEYLSGSLALVGLGQFEVNLSFRRQGIVVVTHASSPFPLLFSPRDGRCCHILAGFHAGVFSYLSGRTLKAFELFCSQAPDENCRILVGTAERLAALRGGDLHPRDQELLAEVMALGTSKGVHGWDGRS